MEKFVFFKVTIIVIFTTVVREFTLITLRLSGFRLSMSSNKEKTKSQLGSVHHLHKT